MARRLIVSLVGVAVLAAAGCADEIPELRQADVDAAVLESTHELDIGELECPGVDELEPIDEGAFASLTCAGVLSGDSVSLDVSLIRVDAESIEATVAIATPILDVAAVEVAAAARLAAELGTSPEVSCAEARVVVAVGREIVCRVTADGGTAGPVDRPVVVRIVGLDGAWELDLTP